MAKRKIHHLHKVVIHPNRWLVWSLVYVLLLTIALVGYIKVSDIRITSEPETVFDPTHSYNDTSLGFGVRYPADWSIDAGSSSVTFLPSKSVDSGVTVTVAEQASRTSIIKNLKVSSESATTLGGVPATKLVNDLGNGHSEVVILANQNGKLYVVSGSDGLVKSVLTTFHFITK